MNSIERAAILQALRTGTVPANRLDALAVGLEKLAPTFSEELDFVASGNGQFKAIRGEYGAGKTFTVRWMQEHALSQGFLTAEVQISETETPLYKLETVYRRLMEQLSSENVRGGALRGVMDRWIERLEEQVLQSGVDENDETQLEAEINRLLESRLMEVSRSVPQFAAALRAYNGAIFDGDLALAQGVVAWLGGQPNVSAATKRAMNVSGAIDHFGALSFLRGFLTMVRDAGYRGLVLVLDEVETLQRMRTDTREKSLNALRQLIDEVADNRFPGLYLMITGTPAFYDGTQGVQRAPALASRLATTFPDDPRFDNPRAAQIRLTGFTHERLVEVGRKVRDIFADGSAAEERVRARVDDAVIERLASSLEGNFGGEVRVVPRLFLKKLVAELLDVVELHEDFDPAQHYKPTLDASELNDAERASVSSVEDFELDLSVGEGGGGVDV